MAGRDIRKWRIFARLCADLPEIFCWSLKAQYAHIAAQEGCWIQVTGCRLQVTGCRLQVTGYRFNTYQMFWNFTGKMPEILYIVNNI
jgi:hypothetical protein